MNKYDLNEDILNDFTDEPNSIIMNFENKNYLFRPADIKNFEEWNSAKKTSNYFLSTDMFEIYKGIRAIKNNRKLSTNSTSSDGIIEYIE